MTWDQSRYGIRLIFSPPRVLSTLTGERVGAACRSLAHRALQRPLAEKMAEVRMQPRQSLSQLVARPKSPAPVFGNTRSSQSSSNKPISAL